MDSDAQIGESNLPNYRDIVNFRGLARLSWYSAIYRYSAKLSILISAKLSIRENA